MKYQDFINTSEFGKSQYTIKYLDGLWDKFGDIPIDNDDRILEPFLDWEAGTDRFEIWHWFDEEYPFGLAAKQGLVCEEDGTHPIMRIAHQFQKELEEFFDSPEQNRHIEVEFLQTCVRKSSRPCNVNNSMILVKGLDLASISIPACYQKKGVMRGVLQIMENVARKNAYLFVYVENILIPEVAESFSHNPEWIRTSTTDACFMKHIHMPGTCRKVFDLSLYLPVLDTSTGEWRRKTVAVIRNAVSRKELESALEEYMKRVRIESRHGDVWEDAFAETIITEHEIY